MLTVADVENVICAECLVTALNPRNVFIDILYISRPLFFPEAHSNVSALLWPGPSIYQVVVDTGIIEGLGSSGRFVHVLGFV